MCIDGKRTCEACSGNPAAEPERMSAMVQTVGVDGLLSGAERDAAAARCEDCTDTAACEEWLGTAAIRGADHAPGFCRNRETFDALASEIPATI